MKKIFILIASLLVLGGCDSINSTTTPKLDNTKLIDSAIIEVESKDELLDIETRITYDMSDIMLKIKNNNNHNINKLNIRAEYYDDTDKKVGEIEYIYQDVIKEGTILTYTALPKGEDYLSYIPNKTKIIISDELEKNNKIKLYNELINVDYYIKGRVIDLDYSSTSKSEMGEVDVMVLYYKNNKMVNYQESIIKKLSDKNHKYDQLEIPKNLDYDHVELIINKAK